MLAIVFNALAAIIGSAIGAIARKGIKEKYINVLNTAMGLAALVLGINVAMTNMANSKYPVLFIFWIQLLPTGEFSCKMKLTIKAERRH